MQRHEYKVVPSPRKGEKARGAKTTSERFALALTTLMNTLGAEGWVYLRSDTLPCDERSGLTGTKTSFQNVLVFQRTLSEDVAAQPANPLRAIEADPVYVPVLGAAAAPTGAAPTLGPANQGLAAE